MEKLKVSDDEFLETYDEVPKLKIWDEQRILDPIKVDEIVTTIDLSKSLGIWTVCRYRSNADFRKFEKDRSQSDNALRPQSDVMIDGQHRYRAAQIKAKDIGWLMQKKFKIILHVYMVDSDADILDIFKRINKSTPVPKIYFDPVSKRTIIEAIDAYRKKHIGLISFKGNPPVLGLSKLEYRHNLANLLFVRKKCEIYNALDFEKMIESFDQRIFRLVQTHKKSLLSAYNIFDETDTESIDEYVDYTYTDRSLSKRIFKVLFTNFTHGVLKERIETSNQYKSFIGIFALVKLKRSNLITEAFWIYTDDEAKKLIRI